MDEDQAPDGSLLGNQLHEEWHGSPTLKPNGVTQQALEYPGGIRTKWLSAIIV